mgnify:CR=1 FL=1
MNRCYPLLLAALLGIAAPTPAAEPPRVMLPMAYHADLQVTDYYVSEKLDGVRGRWDGHRLLTRGGMVVEAPYWFTAEWPGIPMDGELWVGRGRFEEASATVRAGRSAGEAAWRRIRFMVFDLPRDPAPFRDRVRHMRALLPAVGIPWLRAVAQFRVPDTATLDARLAAVVAAGGEGLVLHHMDALYRPGRSAGLLKYKLYQDAEARVVAHTAGRGKYTGKLGALVVERPDGLRFRIGTGFSDAQRADPPPVGSIVTYRYNGTSGSGVPRFARFLHMRHLGPPPDPAR